MQRKLEELIKLVYRKWKADYPELEGTHPDEEMMACFLENRLPARQRQGLKRHLVACDICAERVAVNLKLKPAEEVEVAKQAQGLALEIFLRLKEKALEVLSTSGDILAAGRLLPLPALRSHKIKEFKDEVIISKEFADIRVEAKIENRAGRLFDLTIKATNKATQKIIKDLRVALIKDDLEIESYSTDSGRVIFEHLLLGKYMIEISTLEDKFASIALDIKT